MRAAARARRAAASGGWSAGARESEGLPAPTFQPTAATAVRHPSPREAVARVTVGQQ